MNFLNYVEQEFHINVVIVMLVIAGGFWAKTYLDKWTHIRIGKWRPQVLMAWKTLIVGTIIIAAYILVIRYTDGISKEEWKSTFTSYVFATSFYELIIGPFTRWFQNVLGKASDHPQS